MSESSAAVINLESGGASVTSDDITNVDNIHDDADSDEHHDPLRSQQLGAAYSPAPLPSRTARKEDAERGSLSGEAYILSNDHDSNGNGGGILRTMSRLSRTSTSIPITPPPDGGTKAWLQVLGAHLGMGVAWGMIFTWGSCQSYYASSFLSDHSFSSISWIGSIHTTLIFFVGIFSGRLADAGYYYPLVIAGAIFQTVGLFMASLATEYWHLILSQGLCFGLGIGLAFTPMATLLSTYFERKRSLAIAMGANGGAVCGVVFSSVFRSLLSSAGFPWAMRALAFLVMAGNICALSLMRWRLPPRTTGPWIDSTACRDRTFLFAIGGLFFVFWAVYFAFFYIGNFATMQIHADYTTSVSVLLVMIAIGIPARAICGILADKYTGPLTMLVPTVLFAAVMIFGWTGVRDVQGLFAFAAFYGWPGAAIQSLTPSALAGLAPDVRVRGTRIGMGFFVLSFAVLSGPPIAGALISTNNDHFLYAQIWGGLSFTIGVAALTAARISRTGWTFAGRV